MVFALNNDVVMMNEMARGTLGAGDQSALLRHAADALSGKRELTTVDLPSGVRVRLHTRPVHADNGVAGGVVDVRVVEPNVSVSDVEHPSQRMLLPGLIGTGPLWRRACSEIENGHRAGGWIVLEGEPGVGKLSLLRALHQRVEPTRRFSVVDGADAAAPNDARWLTQARRTIIEEDGTIVLRHLDRLNDVALRLLSSALEEAARRQGAWVAVAVPEGVVPPELGRLLRLFPSTVHAPPLRHHVEDVEQLVPFLLNRLGCGGKLACSAEAMQLLLRSAWPGNVQQLLDALRHVLRHRRSGVISPTDLPPEIQSLSRRRLSTMEAIERDAIVLALQDASGNKAQAARALGMSRATIYRKIHDYGVTVAVG